MDNNTKDMINITLVRIKKIFKDSPKDAVGLDSNPPTSFKRAVCSVTYCGGLVVAHNIEVWENIEKNKLFIKFPRTKRVVKRDGKPDEIRSYNVTHPISNDARLVFEERVLSSYERVLSLQTDFITKNDDKK